MLLLTAAVLRGMGRLWWCVCGRGFLVTLDAWSPHTSQHLLDPYSITHVLHGFVFWWIVRWIFPSMAGRWQIVVAIAIEAGWEILENTPWVIARYRAATAALGYEGDTVVNALADILLAWLGVLLARRLGWRWSLAIFVVTELLLLLWIRDNLTMNVVMLLYPGDALQEWQLGR
jgi:hypothetical protein